ncbi:MAG TPA: glycosyltransferase family 4 protein [Anaerolineae bacterium]
MNILHISPRYLPAVGGAEKHLHEFSRRLAQDGHFVRVVTTNALAPDSLWRGDRALVSPLEEEIDGVEIVRVPLRYLPMSPLLFRALRRLLLILSEARAPLGLLNQLARLIPSVPTWRAQLARDGRAYDVVAGMNIAYESFHVAAYEYARQKGFPFALFPLTHLGEEESAYRLQKYYTMRHQIELVKNSDAVFAQTCGESNFYHSVGVQADRLIRLGPGVEPGEITGGEATRAREKFRLDGRVILFLGTISRDKGTAFLFEAMQLIWARGEKATLVLAGAPLGDWKIPNDERIRAPGVISDADKNDLLAACDVLALPSRVDSFGIVLLEAWLYGKPVIGADAGGIRDVIVEGQNGLRVPYGDPAALANALETVLNNPGLADELGARGRATVLAQHTWAHKYEILRRVYERLAKKRPLDGLTEKNS